MAKLTFKIELEEHETRDAFDAEVELVFKFHDDGMLQRQLQFFKAFLAAQSFSVREVATLDENGNVKCSSVDDWT